MSLEKITEEREELNEKISLLKKEIRIIKRDKNFELKGKEKESYLSYQENRQKVKGPLSEALISYSDEKDYAVNRRKISIEFYKEFLTRLVCEEKGHVEKSKHVASGSSSGTRVYAFCSRCKEMYTRGLSSNEWKTFNERMSIPFNI